MKYGLYAFRDTTMNTFMAPFLQVNEATAKRSATMAAQDPKSTIHQVCDDIEFWQLGTFDDATGDITGKKKMIFTAGQCNPEKRSAE